MQHLERMAWMSVCLLLLLLLLKDKKQDQNMVIAQSANQSTNQSKAAPFQYHKELSPTDQAISAIQDTQGTQDMFNRHRPPCIPCDCAPKKVEIAKTQGKPIKKLPPPPELNAQERQQLLAWVKKNLHTLYPCRDAGQPVYRMTVSLELDQKGEKIKKITLNGDKIPDNAKSCIQSKMTQWKLPKAFGENAPKLVFGLALE
jgi:hypothetical protein